MLIVTTVTHPDTQCLLGRIGYHGDYCDINYTTKLTTKQIREICGSQLQGIECF